MRRLTGALASFIHSVRTSLRYRLVLLITATIVVATIISGVGTYGAARVSLYNQLDLELLSIAENTASQMTDDFEEDPATGSTSLTAENVLVVRVGANTNVTILVGDSDQPLRVDYHEIAVARTQVGSSARNGYSETGTSYRIVAIPLLNPSTGDAFAVVIARELAPTTSGLLNLAALQWVISIAAILLCVVVAIIVAGATLNPIRKLTSIVSDITSTNQLTTIEVQGASEVAELEQSFNTMMESLAASRSQQSRLIADAGHELRTPLTSLRTNIELLIADEKSQMLPEGARSAILSDAAAQLGEFTALVNDLVALSRDDATSVHLVSLDFSEVVERAIDRARRRGPGLHFEISLHPMYIMGDAVMLERAVTNLLDNAVKFSPPGGTITVTLSSADGLVVVDQGPGIATEDIPHIFERFFRSDSSRNTPGTGLGLSIVDYAVTAHNGTVEVAAPPKGGGATFVVRLPEAPPRDPE